MVKSKPDRVVLAELSDGESFLMLASDPRVDVGKVGASRGTTVTRMTIAPEIGDAAGLLESLKTKYGTRTERSIIFVRNYMIVVPAVLNAERYRRDQIFKALLQ